MAADLRNGGCHLIRESVRLAEENAPNPTKIYRREKILEIDSQNDLSVPVRKRICPDAPPPDKPVDRLPPAIYSLKHLVQFALKNF
jgi:hypothetical protein